MRGVLGRRRGCCASCHGASPKVSAPSGRSVRSAGCARSSPSARGGARVPPLHHPHQHSSRRRPREVCRVRCTCSVGVGRRGPRVACAVPAAGESAVAHGRRRTGLFLFSKFTFHLAHRSLRVGQCCSPRIPDSRLTLSRFARPQKNPPLSRRSASGPFDYADQERHFKTRAYWHAPDDPTPWPRPHGMTLDSRTHAEMKKAAPTAGHLRHAG